MYNEDKVPGFAFQYIVNRADELINTIQYLSKNYIITKSKDDILITQVDKTIPYYGDSIKLQYGDYLVPIAIMNDNVIFYKMSEKDMNKLIS